MQWPRVPRRPSRVACAKSPPPQRRRLLPPPPDPTRRRPNRRPQGSATSSSAPRPSPRRPPPGVPVLGLVQIEEDEPASSGDERPLVDEDIEVKQMRRLEARRAARPYDGDDVRCEACRSGEAGAKLMLCDGCERGYHIFCLRPILSWVPAGNWFCAACSCSPPSSSKSSQIKKPNQFSLVQTKIMDFFKIQLSPAAPEVKKRKTLVVSNKKRKLLPFNPSQDPAQRLRQVMAPHSTLRKATKIPWIYFQNEEVDTIDLDFFQFTVD